MDLLHSPSSYSQMSEERDKQDQLDIIGDLYTHTFEGKWEEVVRLYKTKQEVWSAEITSSGDTALHMVINEDKEDVVAELVGIVAKGDDREKKVEALTKVNDVGDTPLHRAAARGSLEMCRCIVEAAISMDLDYLLRITNKWGENPMFVAVLDNRKLAFIYFLQAADKEDNKLLTSPVNGDTVLHAAIRREHYDLAFHIIRLCPNLMGRCNEKGITPLHILASKPSAFKSGSHLSWWQSIMYYCIRVDPLEYDDFLPERTRLRKTSEFDQHPENYRTCYEFYLSFRCGGSVMAKRDPESNYVKGNVPENCATSFQFLFMLLQIFGVLGFGKTFDEIIEERKKHTWSVQILDELMKFPRKTYAQGTEPDQFDLSVHAAEIQKAGIDMAGNKTENDDAPIRTDTALLGAAEKGVVEVVNKILEGLQVSILDTSSSNKKNTVLVAVEKGEGNKNNKAQQRTDSALLVAAQKGVVEVVNKILEQLPVSIHDTSSNKKNVVLVAVENRQPRILQALDKHLNEVLKKPKLWEDLVQAVDADDNTILHVAARCRFQIQGSSALQMQHEVDWYEHVKSFLPSHFVFLTNKNGETPEEIFLIDHEDLVKKSDEWLSRTSESCSVVAALVAGVTFATSSTVPGGNSDNSGKPILQGHAGFDIFAITSLIGLSFSVTALILFLSILTSRKQPYDFMKKLPVKLFLALSSLFVSIISMFISFCSAHSFVLEDKFNKSVLPLYVIISLPVAFTIVEFPLYMDLFKGIFGKVQRQ